MKFGVLSDTHNISCSVIGQIVSDFQLRGVDYILHCGDIEKQHWNAELFGNIPVVCALIQEQTMLPEFQFAPRNWAITKPNDRIVNFGAFKVYVGHQRSFDFLIGSEAKLDEIIDRLSQQFDGLRIICSGHTHHQIYKQGHPVGFINPGAVCEGFDGYEYAVIDTDSNEAIFCRIPTTINSVDPFTVGIITDSGNISQKDSQFWRQLRLEFEKRGVSTVIHIGNLAQEDIGHDELAGFEVYYCLGKKKSGINVANWHQIDSQCPVVEISGYRFFVQHDLGEVFFQKSEYEMSLSAKQLIKVHDNLDFILCGLTPDALFEETAELKIINPGNARNRRRFVTVCLPRTEVTYGAVSFGQNGIW